MAAPSKNFATILDAAVDAESPVDTTLMTGIRDSLIHLREWLGGSFTAAVDHSHNGIDSKLVTGSLQVIKYQRSDLLTCTPAIPLDDTIPQNTEGTEVLTATITPTNTANLLIIEATVVLGTQYAGHDVCALFQDSTANALATTATYKTAGTTGTIVLTHTMTAGTTSATTFKIRIGNTGASGYLNAVYTGTRIFGGTSASSITITEVKA